MKARSPGSMMVVSNDDPAIDPADEDDGTMTIADELAEHVTIGRIRALIRSQIRRMGHRE